MICICEYLMKRLLLFLPTLLLAGCGNAPSNDKVIYTSFYPIYDFTKRVVGDLYEVKNLTPVGAEPHDYELTNRDLEGLSTSTVNFINGLGLEHWKNALPSSIASKTFEVSSSINPMTINGITDPHVWLNPMHGVAQMQNIKNKMVELDKEHKDVFESNFLKAKEAFETLDHDLMNQRKEFNNRYFAVSHAAFGYLADRYDLTMVFVNGLEPDEEPSAQAMERIASQIKEYNISTIFTEELVSPEIAEAIARETGAKLEVLNPLEGLNEEELKTEDYLSIMKTNFAKLKEASK